MLRDRGIEPVIRDYVGEPPSVDELMGVLAKLDGPAFGLLRTKEPAFADCGLDASASAEAVASAIAAAPILLRRPVVVVGEAAVVARPPERVLDLL